MDIRILEDRLHASPQITLDQVREAADRGYRALISNRPDGEEPGQPTAAEIAAAAEAAGLQFRHIPVRGGAWTAEDVSRFREALEDLPQPILGFCRTGTRTTAMWALSEAGRRETDDILGRAASAGYDLSGLRPQLEG